MNRLNTFVYSNNPWIRLGRHLLFWTADGVNFLLLLSVNIEITPGIVYRLLFSIPPTAVITYFILYYVLPRLSGPIKKLDIIFYVLFVYVYIGYGLRYFIYFIICPVFDPSFVPAENIWDSRRVLAEVFSWIPVIFLAIAIKLVKSRTELYEKNERLRAEKRATELSFLKAQMQPHFLFNTLNTLYSETIQESGKAQTVILHLSNLLRFILDECNQPSIPLRNEIKVVSDFVALEKLRHGNRLAVTLEIQEVDPAVEISPLIFLPFVENSFKHTLANVRGTVQIRIFIGMEGDKILLHVENDSINNRTSTTLSGKGIDNSRRQLDLIYGPHYSLTLDDSHGKFKVSLMIPSTIAPHHA